MSSEGSADTCANNDDACQDGTAEVHRSLVVVRGVQTCVQTSDSAWQDGTAEVHRSLVVVRGAQTCVQTLMMHVRMAQQGQEAEAEG